MCFCAWVLTGGFIISWGSLGAKISCGWLGRGWGLMGMIFWGSWGFVGWFVGVCEGWSGMLDFIRG